MKLYEFNTGREYTAEGQIIRFFHDEGKTFMYDVSRMITYFFEGELNKNALLQAYDDNEGKCLFWNSEWNDFDIVEA